MVKIQFVEGALSANLVHLFSVNDSYRKVRGISNHCSRMGHQRLQLLHEMMRLITLSVWLVSRMVGLVFASFGLLPDVEEW